MTALEVTPTNVPARELPFGLLYDVRAVLAVHGLQVEHTEWADFLMAMMRLVDAVPVERGGRKE